MYSEGRDLDPFTFLGEERVIYVAQKGQAYQMSDRMNLEITTRGGTFMTHACSDEPWAAICRRIMKRDYYKERQSHPLEGVTIRILPEDAPEESLE